MVLGNHFWAMSVRYAINKSTLWIVIFVKLHLNTWLPLSLKLSFSSQNHYQKFSRRTACQGPCPTGKEGEEVTCPKGKSTCPGRPDGVFFKPCKQFQHRDKLTPLHANYDFSNMVFHALYNSGKYNHWASNHGCWELEEVQLTISPEKETKWLIPK